MCWSLTERFVERVKLPYVGEYCVVGGCTPRVWVIVYEKGIVGYVR